MVFTANPRRCLLLYLTNECARSLPMEVEYVETIWSGGVAGTPAVLRNPTVFAGVGVYARALRGTPALGDKSSAVPPW